MEMDDRKVKILNAIIQNYLETGEPVGSRTISKFTDLNLSSATIRNEMSDLEEMGYIVQPHTSAGRIPSDSGYRFYVDHMLSEKEKELNDREANLNKKESLLIEKVEKVEVLLQNVAKMLAVNTNYATMVTAPSCTGNRIKFLQLSLIEEHKILAVVVLDGNIVRNTILDSGVDIDSDHLLKLNFILNNALCGLSLEEVNLSIISKLTTQAGEYSQLIRDVLDAVAEAAKVDDDLQIYTSGATNILRYPELSDNQKASELIYTLEEKKMLSGLVNDTMHKEGNEGIQIYIGNEAPVKTMKDCSVVTATYELDSGKIGTIGIIGPKRMDYKKVFETIKDIQDQLNETFKNKK